MVSSKNINERVRHHQQSDLCKADGMRQELRLIDEMMHNEMSDL